MITNTMLFKLTATLMEEAIFCFYFSLLQIFFKVQDNVKDACNHI